MSTYYIQKPENALKRAQELINIGSKKVALELLHSVLTLRRYKTWQKVYETMMLKYMDLCVDLQENRFAKDGLHQYRNMSQQQAPGSLELVINYLVDLSESRAEQAKANADKASLLQAAQITDLEAETSPESIMLSTMTEEGERERMDREVVVPWLKFLWETYRAVLDILRSNSKLEHVYHNACRKAFAFCGNYRRITEFRRLCDTMRQHVGHLQKHIAQNTTNRLRGWEGFTPESIELHLQTRFSQLEVATSLEVWTEAFRTIEDIYSIMQIGKKVPKARLMASYFEKLTHIFLVSENYLFHAYASYKYYQLSKEYNKALTEEERTFQASCALLAALSIPTLNANDDSASTEGAAALYDLDDLTKEKHARMALLLGFTSKPSRKQLLGELQEKGLLDEVLPELKQLYDVLESEFRPLSLVNDCMPALQFVAQHENFKQYYEPLQRLVVLRLSSHLGSIYHTVKMESFQALIAPLNLRPAVVERLLVASIKNEQVQVRLDPQAQCLRFGSAAFPKADGGVGDRRYSNQLSSLARQLAAVVDIISPTDPVAKGEDRARFYNIVASKVESEHEAALERKNVIEKRKEELERQQQERLKEEELLRKEEERKRQAEEEKRLEREAKLRELEKQRLVDEELELQRTRELLKSMGKDISERELGNVDSQTLIKETREKALKAREEQGRRLKEQAKRLDYITRALRMEEMPVLAELYKAQLESDKKQYELQWVEIQAKHKADWEVMIKEKKRTSQMVLDEYKVNFEAVVRGQNAEALALATEEAKRRARIERRRAIISRARQRKAEEDEKLAEEEERLRFEEECRYVREMEEQERTRSMVPNQELMDDDEEEESEESQWRRRPPPVRDERLADKEREQMPEEEGWSRAGPARRTSTREEEAHEQQTSDPSKPQKYVPPSRRAAMESEKSSLPTEAWRRDRDEGRGGLGASDRDGGGSSRWSRGANREGYDDAPRRGGFDDGPRKVGFEDNARRGGGYDDSQRRGGRGFDDGPRRGYDEGPRRGGGYEDGPRRSGGFDDDRRSGGAANRERGGFSDSKDKAERPKLGQGGGRSLADLQKQWGK